MAVVLYSYYASLSGNSYSSLAPLQTAMELAKELQVSYSNPAVSYVVPTQKGQPLNFSVNTLVTLNLNYSGPVYVIPFLMNASYSPYYYVPSPMFSNGYINEVSKPNLVGYANVSGNGVKVLQLSNAEIYSLDGVVATVSGYAFEVPLNEVLNFTYTTNQSYVPAFWVVANISGKYYRIAYPVIVFRPAVNTYSGSASTVKIITYGQLYQELFGPFSLLFETQPGSTVLVNGNYNNITTWDDIGYYDGGSGMLEFNGIYQYIYANYLNYSPGTNLVGFTAIAGHIPPYGPSNNIPYVPISSLINPMYNAFNPYQYQLQLEKEANDVYSAYAGSFTHNPGGTIAVGQPTTYNQPIIFTGPVTFATAAGPGPYNVTFNAPVIFEGSVTDEGVNLTFNNLVIFLNTFAVSGASDATFNGPTVFEGNVCIENNFVSVFKQGVLFNSSWSGATVTFNAPMIKIVSKGPIIMNLTRHPSSIVFNGDTNIYSSSLVSLTANQVTFNGNTNIQSTYPVFIQTVSPPYGQVIFNGENSISGGLVINSTWAYVTFNGGSSLDITNGDLLINAGNRTNTYLVFNGNNEIRVDGPIAMQAYSITFNGNNTDIKASGYAIFYGQQVTLNGNYNNITVHQGIPSNAMNSIVIKYITPIALNPTNPIYVTGWFSIVPNNASVNAVSTTLLNKTYQVSLTLAAVPKSPTLYNLVLYVNSTPYVLATVSPYELYMYVIEGYVQGSTTYVEVIILSQSGLITSKTLQVTLPFYTGILLTVGQEPNYQVLVYAGSTDTPWQVIYNNGPYVSSTQCLKQMPNQVSYLQYYYLISPPTFFEFQMLPTYYVSSVGPLVLNVEANALSPS